MAFLTTADSFLLVKAAGCFFTDPMVALSSDHGEPLTNLVIIAGVTDAGGLYDHARTNAASGNFLEGLLVD